MRINHDCITCICNHVNSVSYDMLETVPFVSGTGVKGRQTVISQVHQRQVKRAFSPAPRVYLGFPPLSLQGWLEHTPGRTPPSSLVSTLSNVVAEVRGHRMYNRH